MAGTDTTRNQLACAVALLGAHPEQWRRLVADPSLAPRAVDETMRYLGAVQGTVRVASEDIAYRDVAVPARHAAVPEPEHRQPRPRGVRDPRRGRHRSRDRRSRTSRSAPGSTTASAPTSRVASCRRRWRCSRPACPTSSSRARWSGSRRTSVSGARPACPCAGSRAGSRRDGDITTLAVDAIVNAANSSLLGGGGSTVRSIAPRAHRLGVPAARRVRDRRREDDAGVRLPPVVIHTWAGVAGRRVGEPDLLASCYRRRSRRPTAGAARGVPVDLDRDLRLSGRRAPRSR